VIRSTDATQLARSDSSAPGSALSGLATFQAAGELPAVQVLFNFSGNDEGTVMLEIVHDCAPGATLLFASAGPTAF